MFCDCRIDTSFTYFYDFFFFFQAEDGIRDLIVTGVQTCALPILVRPALRAPDRSRRERDEPLPHRVLPQEPLRRRPIGERDVQRGARVRHRDASEGQDPVDLVTPLRPPPDVGIERPPAVVETDPLRDA